ncbi:MAG TPA: sulfatase-like hydrolase/transferase [Vicinamibacteria bacterium]|nr:sulfatase-like hydrolase/transferase [Vicinamibacteria bacterium]
MTRRRLIVLAISFLPLAAGAALGLLRPRSNSARHSVLLVTLDTLRADRLGAYGNRDGLTPALDALAAGGTVFDEALASVPLTLPSHATILTGLEPPRHGVHDNGTYVVPADLPTLATRLEAEGYETGAFLGAYVLDRRFGLARGFHSYDDRIERAELGRSELESERRGEAVVAAAASWLAARSSRFFAWVHLYDTHAPYDAPAAYREAHASQPYDAEVAYADACVGRLLEAARAAAQRIGGGLLVCALADHGESLGEHGELTHGFFVYQSTLRIPFVLSGPGVARGERRRGPARTADLMPTLLGRLGLKPTQPLDGVDLFEKRVSVSYAESAYPASFGWSPLRSIRQGTLKLIDAPRPELYDLESDPGEVSDLSFTRAEDMARLRGALQAFRRDKREAARAAVDGESAERLRALGYVATPPAAEEPDGGPDPKERIGAYRAFEDATWAEAREDTGKALEGLRRVVAADPGNPVFRRALASSLRKAGRAAEAASALATLGEDVVDPVLWHERGLAMAEAGRLDQAEASERKAIELNPVLPEPHNHLGVLLARSGRPTEALQRFETVTALDPNNARAWNNRGNVLRELGRSDEAAAAYRKATELAPGDADSWNGLGVMAVQAGRAGEAAGLLRKALELEPQHAEARLNLAVALAQSGRPAEAIHELTPLLDGRGEIGKRARQLRSQLSLSNRLD